MRVWTNKIHVVGDLIILEVGEYVAMLHPGSYNAEPIGHQDTLNCHNIGICDQFGNQCLLTKSLRAT